MRSPVARLLLPAALGAFAVATAVAQPRNPYAQFGHEGYVATTPQERAAWVWSVDNPDPGADVAKIAVDVERGAGYAFARDGALVDSFAVAGDQRARFLSVDPMAHNFAGVSPYLFAGNNPIQYVDV